MKKYEDMPKEERDAYLQGYFDACKDHLIRRLNISEEEAHKTLIDGLNEGLTKKEIAK